MRGHQLLLMCTLSVCASTGAFVLLQRLNLQAIGLQELAQQHSTQAATAGAKAATAEDQAQQFEAQGKFADAAAAALQADRYEPLVIESIQVDLPTDMLCCQSKASRSSLLQCSSSRGSLQVA